MSERLSIFDLVKIGIGPSSSHTMGPWRAMLDFTAGLAAEGCLERVERVRVELNGSLAKTGRGHGTNTALMMGLLGEEIETTDLAAMPGRLRHVRESGRLALRGGREIAFEPARDIVCDPLKPTPVHANTLTVAATLDDGREMAATYFSVGGGFIQREGRNDPPAALPKTPLPFPIDCGADLLAHCDASGLPLWEVIRANERSWRTDAEIDARVDAIVTTMVEAIETGCRTDGELPGGLHVTRRAKGIHDRLMAGRTWQDRAGWIRALQASPAGLTTSTAWITCFALAVNEVNAAYGRIVTAPTNGACGVIPAVLFHHAVFTPGVTPEVLRRFVLVAGEIGCIFKKNATISAAAGGCQAEIGVSSSMAAAALTAVSGGTPAQSLMAAEIAMEHHLGLTCDPVGGLVQIPCIERNAMGAMKAVTAAQIALMGDPAQAKVSLDAVVRTMMETARDMSTRYKETGEAGLAQRIPVALADC